MYQSDADLNEEKRGMPADERVEPRQALRCFEGFGDDRDEI